MIGPPECWLHLAHVTAYLARAPKSWAAYQGLGAARQLVAERPHYPVPAHLRNPTTALDRQMGLGEGYVHASQPGGDEVEFLPPELTGSVDLQAVGQRPGPLSHPRRVTPSRQLIARLEAHALAAWPATITEHTGTAGCCGPLRASIAGAPTMRSPRSGRWTPTKSRRRWRARLLSPGATASRTGVQVSPDHLHVELERELDRRGWGCSGPTLVMAAAPRAQADAGTRSRWKSRTHASPRVAGGLERVCEGRSRRSRPRADRVRGAPWPRVVRAPDGDARSRSPSPATGCSACSASPSHRSGGAPDWGGRLSAPCARTRPRRCPTCRSRSATPRRSRCMSSSGSPRSTATATAEPRPAKGPSTHRLLCPNPAPRDRVGQIDRLERSMRPIPAPRGGLWHIDRLKRSKGTNFARNVHRRSDRPAPPRTFVHPSSRTMAKIPTTTMIARRAPARAAAARPWPRARRR